MAKIHVIFKYEEEGFGRPELFRDAEECEARFNGLVEALRSGLEDSAVTLRDTADGHEAACPLCDIIYRMATFTMSDGEPREYFLYCDMEDEDDFRIGNVFLTDSRREAWKRFAEGSLNLKMKANGLLAEPSAHNTSYREKLSTEKDKATAFMDSDCGEHGYCFYGCMLTYTVLL